MISNKFLNKVASVSLIGLIFLCLAWEIWLAPVRSGGSWLLLKAIPLLIPLFGILHGRYYSYQYSLLLITLYIGEGVVRVTTDNGPSVLLAMIELILAVLFFIAAVLFIRQSRT